MYTRDEQGGLKTISVDKHKMLDTIKKNMDQHLVAYKEAMLGFEKHYKSVLEDMINRFEFDNEIKSHVSFDIPKSHEEDYKSIIEMLEMSVDDVVYVTYDQFQRYVRDNWEWKKDFLMLSAKYN
jgi:hypothetical protein